MLLGSFQPRQILGCDNKKTLVSCRIIKKKEWLGNSFKDKMGGTNTRLASARGKVMRFSAGYPAIPMFVSPYLPVFLLFCFWFIRFPYWLSCVAVPSPISTPNVLLPIVLSCAVVVDGMRWVSLPASVVYPIFFSFFSFFCFVFIIRALSLCYDFARYPTYLVGFIFLLWGWI